MRKTFSIIFALTILVSFLANYPSIASAPSHAASVSHDLFGAGKQVQASGGSNWYQQFKAERVAAPEIVNSVSAIPTEESFNEHETPASRSFDALTSAPETHPAFIDKTTTPGPQGDFCDPAFIGEPMTFSQSVSST